MKVTVREDGESDPLWPPEDFSGEWILEWPSGALKYTCFYVDGCSEGLTQSYWENGQVAQTGLSSGGQPIGVWEDFHADGRKFKETIYENDSDFTVTWFNIDGSIRKVTIFKDGIEIS